MCPKVYLSKDSLCRHMRENHSTTTKKAKTTIKCPECSNTYTPKSGLNSHFKTWHNMPYIHVCSWCDKRYLSKALGLQHIKTQHDGDASFIARNAEFVAQAPNKWVKPFEAVMSKQCKVNIVYPTSEDKAKKAKIYKGPMSGEETTFLINPTTKTTSNGNTQVRLS